ncbi:hypothetical protein CR513_33868, partial [Mucuna pruriens]
MVSSRSSGHRTKVWVAVGCWRGLTRSDRFVCLHDMLWWTNPSVSGHLQWNTTALPQLSLWKLSEGMALLELVNGLVQPIQPTKENGLGWLAFLWLGDSSGQVNLDSDDIEDLCNIKMCIFGLLSLASKNLLIVSQYLSGWNILDQKYYDTLLILLKEKPQKHDIGKRVSICIATIVNWVDHATSPSQTDIGRCLLLLQAWVESSIR